MAAAARLSIGAGVVLGRSVYVLVEVTDEVDVISASSCLTTGCPGLAIIPPGARATAAAASDGIMKSVNSIL